MKTITTALAISLLTSAGALAGTWKGEGDLGYNSVAGNSESEALAFKLVVAYAHDKWTHTGEISANSASDDEETSAEVYTFNLNSRREISQKMYGFGNFRYQDDRFSSFEYQASLAGGVGYHLIKADDKTLDLEGGLGYRSSEQRQSQEVVDEAIALGKLSYKHAITDSTKFESYLLTEAGEENTFIEGEVSLKVAMTETLALKVAYQAKHNTDVEPGTEKTDRYTTVSVNYSF